MIVSTRRFDTVSSDYDARVMRLLPNDSIFADLFGGESSD